ncbi:MAG: hypothetical protein JW913_17110 [Chitinispirillaceae bacterium]|nr:hypothetical protein [Chitinispirillaceae bacterium]
MDYYADATGNFQSDAMWPDGSGSLATPTFNFVKKETFGYSLNGKEFPVPQGGSYSGIADNFGGTTARILSGVNDCIGADAFARPFTKSVTTGWTCRHEKGLHSKIFSLWGMADFGTDETDVFALEMSYHPGKCCDHKTGCFGIGARNEDGEWVNAVEGNFEGTKQFVMGQWKPEYGLGTYGVDPYTKTAWAVLNYNGDFAVSDGIEDPGCGGGHGHHGCKKHGKGCNACRGHGGNDKHH